MLPSYSPVMVTAPFLQWILILVSDRPNWSFQSIFKRGIWPLPVSSLVASPASLCVIWAWPPIHIESLPSNMYASIAFIEFSINFHATTHSIKLLQGEVKREETCIWWMYHECICVNIEKYALYYIYLLLIQFHMPHSTWVGHDSTLTVTSKYNVLLWA